MKDGDQTTYINVARLSMMMEANGITISRMPATNRPLLDVDHLGSVVLGLQAAMKAMKIEAVPVSSLTSAQQCEEVIGKLISFEESSALHTRRG